MLILKTQLLNEELSVRAVTDFDILSGINHMFFYKGKLQAPDLEKKDMLVSRLVESLCSFNFGKRATFQKCTLPLLFNITYSSKTTEDKISALEAIRMICASPEGVDYVLKQVPTEEELSNSEWDFSTELSVQKKIISKTKTFVSVLLLILDRKQANSDLDMISSVLRTLNTICATKEGIMTIIDANGIEYCQSLLLDLLQNFENPFALPPSPGFKTPANPESIKVEKCLQHATTFLTNMVLIEKGKTEATKYIGVLVQLLWEAVDKKHSKLVCELTSAFEILLICDEAKKRVLEDVTPLTNSAISVKFAAIIFDLFCGIFLGKAMFGKTFSKTEKTTISEHCVHIMRLFSKFGAARNYVFEVLSMDPLIVDYREQILKELFGNPTIGVLHPFGSQEQDIKAI